MSKFNIHLVPKKIVNTIKYEVENNRPILLVGDTGTGKTSLIRHLAGVYGKKLIRVNLNGATGTDELLGKYLFEDGETRWIDGSLVEAIKGGNWILFDEINAATPEVLFILHSLLDDDRQIQLKEHKGEIIEPHKDFRFFASMNPSYAGTKELNKALLSRFPAVLSFEFPDSAIEAEIIKIHSKVPSEKVLENLIKMAHELRFACRSGLIHAVCSTRELISFCNLVNGGLSESEALAFSILNKCDEDEKDTVLYIANMFFDVPRGNMEGRSLLEDYHKLEKRLEAKELTIKKLTPIKDAIDVIRGNFEKKYKDKKFGECSKELEALVKILLGGSIKGIRVSVSKKDDNEVVGFTAS